MTHKKGRIAAYGMAAAVMVSAMGVNVRAEKLSDYMPSAGIGVTFSDGITLAKIQARLLAEGTQDPNMKVSVSEMKAYLEEKKAPRTSVSASAAKEAEVQTALAWIETKKEELAQARQAASNGADDMVIATVASAASNGAVPSLHADEAEGDASGDLQAQDIASAYFAGENGAAMMEDLMKMIGEKVIEETQSKEQIAAAEAAAMTDEERGFTNLVIADVRNYVNIRSDAGEDSEIVGKLYDKSVGTYLSEKDGWYEIKSGNVTGYVKSEFCVTGKEAIELAKKVGTRIATVTTTTLKVREDASTEASVLGLVPLEEELRVVDEKDGWVKVDIEEGYGWVSKDYVSLRTDFVKAESKAEEAARLAKEAEERRRAQAAAAANTSRRSESGGSKTYNSASSYIPAGGGSEMGNAVVQFALQFVGNPYVWGGTSLTNGADCSGFVLSVYKNFGVSLPHSSAADRNVGSAVGSLEEAQPGDLICYSGHVALYMGGGEIVHASSPKTGIIVSKVNYRNILAIRRIF